jgi:hypothetical protein
MKIRRSFLAAALLIGSLGATNSTVAADGVYLPRIPLDTDSYCHDKFATIQDGTLGTTDPLLRNSTTGDISEFQGPCTEEPLGHDQQWDQPLLPEHRFANDYED